MQKINLPDGHYAEMRENDDLRRGDVRAALRAADKESVNLMAEKFGLDAIASIQDSLIVRFLRHWSLQEKDVEEGGSEKSLPINVEVIQDLPLKYHQPLADVVAPLLQKVLGGGESQTAATKDPISEAPSSK
jgi:hypothetical protein